MKDATCGLCTGLDAQSLLDWPRASQGAGLYQQGLRDVGQPPSHWA